jgi:hypothetical protein
MENLSTNQLECLKKYTKEQFINMKVNMINCKKIDKWVDDLFSLNLIPHSMFIAEINRYVFVNAKSKVKGKLVKDFYERIKLQSESEGRPMKNFFN